MVMEAQRLSHLPKRDSLVAALEAHFHSQMVSCLVALQFRQDESTD